MSISHTRKFLGTVNSLLSLFKRKLLKQSLVDGKISVSLMDEHQKLCYDLAWADSEMFTMEALLDYIEAFSKDQDSLERKLAYVFVGHCLEDIVSRFSIHQNFVSLSTNEYFALLSYEDMNKFIQAHGNENNAIEILQKIQECNHFGDYGLTEEQQMMQDSFRAFAEEKVAPIAEKIHREDLDIPEEIIQQLTSMGCFGLSIPDIYGGFQSVDTPDHVSIAVVTEELSRISLGVAGSLITRPEIVSKAILKGGTKEQKELWLPKLASGEMLCSVAVTEPDFGSDVANITLSANRSGAGWLLNGVKTWCTFAGRADILLVLARTDTDLSKQHKGLSLFLAEKPPYAGHAFEYSQSEGSGSITGRAISTIGYRGMHSFEVVFDNFFVPGMNLIGMDAGLGQGFYLQMAGFAGGRFQTAARVAGVMQASLEKAYIYAKERKVFSLPLIRYGLTAYKLVKMAAITQAVRQATYKSAQLLDKNVGMVEASLIKLYACKLSEWVTREAMQIHGGMGYAEEYAISRYYLDARVFSIFEGAEDVLALRVIAKEILKKELNVVAE